MKRTAIVVAALIGLALGSGATYGLLHATGRLAAPVAEPELLLTLGQTLDAEHRRVDLLVDEGKIAEAIAALDQLRALRWPSRAAAGDPAVLLRHDLYGRLLRLRLDHPEGDPRPPAELLALCDEGLADADAVEGNAFTARLYAIRGELLEALHRDDEALAAYERALDINRALLRRALGEGAP